MFIKTCHVPPCKKRQVKGCQIIKFDQTNFGTKPNRGKKRFSACDNVWRINIPKFIDTNTLIASGNNDGLVEKLPGFDWN